MGLLEMILLLYIMWDVNYFIRCIFTVVIARLYQSKKKITDTTTTYAYFTAKRVVKIGFSNCSALEWTLNGHKMKNAGHANLTFCTSQDVDIFIRHMNNARYLRELDFARFHFYALTGLYEKVKEQNGGAVQGASSIRYRRSIPIFHPYKIQTKLIWWDDKAIYLEQQFTTLADGFVRAVALSKQCITNCNVLEVMETYNEAATRPEMPNELKLWLDAIEVSSQKLRQ